MKFKSLILVSLITILLLAGTVSAFEGDTPNYEEVLDIKFKQMSIGEKIFYLISPQFKLQTTAGQARNCANDPYEEAWLPTSKTVCKEGDLVNWFRIIGNEWIFFGEFEGPAFLTGGSDMYYQCYDCPDVPTECNVGDKMCITETKYQVCQSDETWREYTCAAGTACGGDGVCSAQNVGAICGDGNCAPGEEGICLSDCPGTNGYEPPAEYCGNSICSTYEDTSETCPEDCGYEEEIEESEGELIYCGDNIAISFSGPLSVKPGEDIIVEATFTNPGKACIINSEAGIYIKEYGTTGGLLAIAATPIRSYGGVLFEEGFVDSYRLEIPESSQGEMTYIFKAPTALTYFGADAGQWAGKRNWNGYSDDYFLIVGTFEECGNGYNNWETRDIAITESGSVTGTCGNGEIDEDENCYTCAEDAGCSFGENCVPKEWSLWIPLLGDIKMPTTDYECKPYGILDILPWIILIGGALLIGTFIYKKIR